MNSIFADPARLLLQDEAQALDFEAMDALLSQQGDAAQATGQFSAHAVSVGDIGFLLPGDEVSELIEKSAVCRLPNTSTWFDGIASVRGNMIPVFDLHELFDIGRAESKRRMIVIGENETAVAFWVDDYPRLVMLAEEEGVSGEALPIPPLVREHARRFYAGDDRVWIDLDIAAFSTTLGAML